MVPWTSGRSVGRLVLIQPSRKLEDRLINGCCPERTNRWSMPRSLIPSSWLSRDYSEEIGFTVQSRNTDPFDTRATFTCDPMGYERTRHGKYGKQTVRLRDIQNAAQRKVQLSFETVIVRILFLRIVKTLARHCWFYCLEWNNSGVNQLAVVISL